MSSTLSPFEEDAECQRTFDRLVSSTAAGDYTKLAALRQLTHEQMNDLLGNTMLIQPAWDEEWFCFQDEKAPLLCLKEFPRWVKGLTIGSVKDEFAMFHQIWKSWDTEQLITAVKATVSSREMATNILQAYDITSTSQPRAVQGLTDFITDTFYAALPAILSELEVPTSIYRFDQADPFENSVYRGYAYHCLDTPLLNRFPAVAGPKALEGLRATADLFSVSIADFVYREQPWECISKNGKVMSINGKESKLVKPREARWKDFVATKEGATEFAGAGCRLVAYMADGRWK